MKGAPLGFAAILLLAFHGFLSLLGEVFHVFPFFHTVFYPVFPLFALLASLVALRERDRTKWIAIVVAVLSALLLGHWVYMLVVTWRA
jgi:asparagine N-glycosylation enzyme membrane subunit Stt3